ncbi:hypothetical protein L1987_75769 [Smallanthus sonchifolius]|uniref:Uncharacterized protein n=1 Tax=Smallanthus sonchifolius TaxID=185202 RepID=A0ACB9A6G7_9ASTR|nr:hypothetical protein L1987_75769 [Smallanthus sonchifolius]
MQVIGWPEMLPVGKRAKSKILHSPTMCHHATLLARLMEHEHLNQGTVYLGGVIRGGSGSGGGGGSEKAFAVVVVQAFVVVVQF